MRRRRRVRVPASSANLGPGFDVLAARSACTWSSRSSRPARSPSRPTCRSHATGATSPFAASSAARRRRLRRSAISSDIPLCGGLGTSAAAYVAGLAAADSMFELDADLLAHATALEGHPDNVAAALLGGFVDLRRTVSAARLDRPAGLEAVLVAPHEPVRTAQARAALPARGPAGRRGLQRRPRARLLVARPRARRLRPDRPRARRPPPPAAPRATCSRARWSSCARARELGALGATISGAGPTVLVWTRSTRPAPSPLRAAPAVRGLGRGDPRAFRGRGRGRSRAVGALGRNRADQATTASCSDTRRRASSSPGGAAALRRPSDSRRRGPAGARRSRSRARPTRRRRSTGGPSARAASRRRAPGALRTPHASARCACRRC